ncbi:MAG: hypothetical protein AAF724_10600 [Pseudomonadota bacterium]
MKCGKRVVFAGLARNCAHSLPAILRSLEDIGSGADDWGYVFLENNSFDGTARQLRSFHNRHHRGVMRSFGDLESKVPKRTERLAILRNKCLDEIFASETMSAFEYVVILDLDGVNERIDKDRLLYLMELDRPPWAAIFANQSESYYDLWALRHPTISPDDCLKRVRLRPAGMSEEEAVKAFVDTRKISLDPSEGLFEVDSAFGGLGLYDLQALPGCRYIGVDEEGHEICEHVSLHADLKERGGRLYIDPALINGTGTSRHDARLKLAARLKRSFHKRRARIRAMKAT